MLYVLVVLRPTRPCHVVLVVLRSTRPPIGIPCFSVFVGVQGIQPVRSVL